MKKIILAVVVVLLVLAGFVFLKPTKTDDVASNSKQTKSETIAYKNITPYQLNQMMKNKDFELIDVHIPEQKHIKGTDKFIPYNEISSRIDELPQDKNRKIVLYCRSGSMSRVAAEELVKMGYTNVYNLDGGINAWKAQGYDKN